MFNRAKHFFLSLVARAALVHSVVRVVRGRYDAAATTDENRRHWAASDGLSANAANSPDVRQTLRNRARYEVANNSYAKGIVLTLANDCIGTGPRLQMLSSKAEVNRRIEQAFMAWAFVVGLAGKLRTLRLPAFLSFISWFMRKAKSIQGSLGFGPPSLARRRGPKSARAGMGSGLPGFAGLNGSRRLGWRGLFRWRGLPYFRWFGRIAEEVRQCGGILRVVAVFAFQKEPFASSVIFEILPVGPQPAAKAVKILPLLK